MKKTPNQLHLLNNNIDSTCCQVYNPATINLTLRYPDELDNVVNGLLEQVQHMGILNKRRTTIKSIKLVK